MLRTADSRGYPVNPAYKNIEFKGQIAEIDSIYLTRAELEAMENVDLTSVEDGRNLELARDLFMIGVWTAQRVSDYNNLSPDNIQAVKDGDEEFLIAIHCYRLEGIFLPAGEYAFDSEWRKIVCSEL